jgi:hypothetical protein
MTIKLLLFLAILLTVIYLISSSLTDPTFAFACVLSAVFWFVVLSWAIKMAVK